MFFNVVSAKVIFIISTIAWFISVLLTDKYKHKYSRRYYSYLFASHAKATVIMAILLWITRAIAGSSVVPLYVLCVSFILFIAIDFIISLPRRSQVVDEASKNLQGGKDAEKPDDSGFNVLPFVDRTFIENNIPSDLDKFFVEFIKINLPEKIAGSGNVLVVDDVPCNNGIMHEYASILIGRKRINDVIRLNNFIKICAECVNKGGCLVIRYMPMENVLRNLKKRHQGPLYCLFYILHFIWYRAIPKIPLMEKLYFLPGLSWLDKAHLHLVKKRNRALAKAEVWGRLAFYGMRVLAESKGDGELYVIAQRVDGPIQDKVPSFYMIASLEKVGLDGKIMYSHKIRTMYPFSEFLQKRVFEDHGLATTGKFANDFRLTGYGKFLRKYWLDELPQIFDWLRGDVKLVGMRATSPQFLSLYPKELYDLYIQTKPGLIPPIFDENTTGFDQIVDIELEYLRNYQKHPIMTDIRYFWKTFSDIVLKGVRSK